MKKPVETGADQKISSFFDLFSQPARIQILWIIQDQPACVCHLVAALGLRQASISQHLMILRKAGWVTTRRDSRNIYYRLANPELIGLVEKAANILSVSVEELNQLSIRPLANCPCPHCHPELPPEYSCKSLPNEYLTRR